MDLKTFVHNDITWCANSDACENTKCYRHLFNRIPEEGVNIVTMAAFKGSELCPLREQMRKGK